jgi:hypothetical protein
MNARSFLALTKQNALEASHNVLKISSANLPPSAKLVATHCPDRSRLWLGRFDQLTDQESSFTNH